MKLSELKEQVDRALALRPRTADLEVVVVRGDPSVGPRANTQIKHAGAGFDWESGLFVLSPTDPVYKRTSDDEIKALRKSMDRMAWDAIQMHRLLKQAGITPPSPLTKTPEPTHTTLQAMICAYEDATGERLSDGDGEDLKIVRAMFDAVFAVPK